jgi:hypothetical protein
MSDRAQEHFDEGNKIGAECLAAALDYLRRGWSPLCLCPPDHLGVGKAHRCTSPGKRPLTDWKAYQDRPPTEQEVRVWWRRHPNANVGLALGPVSGMIGIGVDGEEGETVLAELSAGELPLTWEFRTGQGRRLFYAIPRASR